MLERSVKCCASGVPWLFVFFVGLRFRFLVTHVFDTARLVKVSYQFFSSLSVQHVHVLRLPQFSMSVLLAPVNQALKTYDLVTVRRQV